MDSTENQLIVGSCFDSILQRRSIRTFLDRPVSVEILKELIEIGTWAPCAGNRQDWFFTLVLTESVRQEIAKAVTTRWHEIEVEIARSSAEIACEVQRYSGNFSWFVNAPAIVCVSTRRATSFEEDHLHELASVTNGGVASAAMAAQNIMLAAHIKGLGSCCLTGPLAASKEISSLVGLSRRQQLVCLICLGYAAEKPAAPARKTITDVVKLV